MKPAAGRKDEEEKSMEVCLNEETNRKRPKVCEKE
jgi:hypothetical protein